MWQPRQKPVNIQSMGFLHLKNSLLYLVFLSITGHWWSLRVELKPYIFQVQQKNKESV